MSLQETPNLAALAAVIIFADVLQVTAAGKLHRLCWPGSENIVPSTQADENCLGNGDAGVGGMLDLPMATIDGDDELQVGASTQADENGLGCGGRLPADSAYAFCARCE